MNEVALLNNGEKGVQASRLCEALRQACLAACLRKSEASVSGAQEFREHRRTRGRVM